MSHPTKETAEEVAKRHGEDAVIVFHVDADEGGVRQLRQRPRAL
jgi:hypothetical protein